MLGILSFVGVLSVFIVFLLSNLFMRVIEVAHSRRGRFGLADDAKQKFPSLEDNHLVFPWQTFRFLASISLRRAAPWWRLRYESRVSIIFEKISHFQINHCLSPWQTFGFVQGEFRLRSA